MTKANLSYINATAQDINHMPVSYEYFAQYSNLYGRAYGLLTGEDRGITDAEGNIYKSFVMNDCLRNALYQGLLRVSQEAERQVGYKLSTRYLNFKPEAWRGAGKVLLIPGLEEVEVTENWYEIPADNTFTLNYYAEENLDLFDDGGVIIARISETIFENPRFAYLRNLSDGNKLCRIDTEHPRYAEQNAGDWLLPLATNIVDVDVLDTVSAFHQRHVDVVVTKPDVSSLVAGGSIQPVYPNTNQIVPHTVLAEDATTVTYRFLIWALVKPAFADETIEWRLFPVHKFYSDLELRYVAEEAEYLTLIWSEGDDDQYTYQYDPDDPDEEDLPRLKVIIAQAEKGIVHLYANDELLVDLNPYWWRACGSKRTKMPESISLEIPIKVAVDRLPAKHRGQVDKIREAVIARVAAELPTESCGCTTTVGFVFEQQKEYGAAYMNPFTGVEVVKTDFGKRHGQQMYINVMREVQLFRKPVRLGAPI